MKRSLNCIFLALLLLVSNGCVPNLKNRDCGSFDHPALEQWQPVKQGSTVVFTSAEGASANYLLKSVTSNEPYVASVDVNSGDTLANLFCRLTSTHVFSAEDSSHIITLEFSSSESAQDGMLVTIDVNLTNEETGEAGHLVYRARNVDLLNPQQVYDNNFGRTEFYTSLMLDNGQTYSDVVKHSLNVFVIDPEYSHISLNSVVLARNAGLIQISRNDGSVFTIVPE